ncbi:ABC transporter substrate-binding protein [Tomitella biformata]|uniref:ABC transporter substrate-binding protein n=1 Tax=Tomitella biformata TaxID=630403 RepID=UPI000464B0DF|nr:ABC transporter substrate-binding protein [Tomitella biformata]
MTIKKRVLVALGVAAVLFAGACGSGGGDSAQVGGVSGPSGEAVFGGTATAIQLAEPRTLDPVAVQNAWSNSPLLFNALYGTLWVENVETGEIEYKIAEDLSTADGGKTFTLVLRDGVEFSDGTPLDASAVKFAWDRMKDPGVVVADLAQAAMLESTEVVDARTLTVTLVEPVPGFAQAVLQTSLNWIASPATLAADQSVMDSNPIGAGPFTLERWSRQDVIVLTKNDNYYDAPRPYLDKLEIRTIADPDQRYNTVLSGGADLATENRWQNLDRAATAGLQSPELSFNGGTGLVLNMTKAPFDDPRAREALALALDVEAINTSLYEGTGEVPLTLFDESSPFYKDIPLGKHDPVRAQELLDELAAEGKPLDFTMSLFANIKDVGEAVQTQLSVFNNVETNIKLIDIAEFGRIMGQKDYEVVINAIMFGEPEPRLLIGLHSTSIGNYSGIADPELDAALEKGRISEDFAERDAAYEVVQKRIAELNPTIFYTRPAAGIIASPEVGGIKQYGMGSVLAETLWIQK